MWDHPGELLYLMRKLRRWTLAQAGNSSGLAASYIGRVEHGLHAPSAETIRRLVQAYAPRAAEALGDVVVAAFHGPEHRDARTVAERILETRDHTQVGLDVMADALGVSRPDILSSLVQRTESSYWALLAVLEWAGEWSQVTVACATGDDLAITRAVHELQLPGSASPDARDAIAEAELVRLWRAVGTAGQSLLLHMARDLVEHPATATVRLGQLSQLAPDAQEALATLIRHLAHPS